MREIKFRAWNSDKNKMVYSSDLFQSRSIIFLLRWEAIPGGMWKEQIADRFNGELMQFTGMHDKNGKEIYFGDIVRGMNASMGHDENREVKPFKWYGISPFCETEYSSHAAVDVIGNIYENPDLLK
jgi:uncharacterized phage protein (TIGR01671 family)